MSSDPPPSAPNGRYEARFAMPPIELLDDRMLLPIDKNVGALLDFYASPGYTCWPTNKTLAKRLGCHRSTIIRALNRLESAGWIVVEPSTHTRRHGVIKLQWRRAPTKTKMSVLASGVAPVRRGCRTRATGGCSTGATQSRSSNPEPKPEPAVAERIEEKILTEEQVAMYESWQRMASVVMRAAATRILEEHRQATALLSVNEKPAPGDQLGE